MRKRLEQSLIRPIYAAAIWVRGRYWQLRRPLLFGVRALIVRGDQVLLIRHRAGKQPWAIPGGGVKRYERLEEAARREAWEETGVVVRVDHLLGLYDSFRGGVSNYIAVFACTPLGDPNPPRSLEIAEARFFPHDQLPSGLDRASRQRIAEYYAGQRGVARLW